jgi:hypothetical protein
MVATLIDPRLALWDRRAVLMRVIAMQRVTFKTLCGCPRCGDSEARKQLAGLIHKNAQEIDAIEDLITDHPTLGA